MRKRIDLALILGLVAIAIACGGQVQGKNPPACTSSSSCSNGDTCTETVDDCQGTNSVVCTCQNGQFVCPKYTCGTPTNPPNPGGCQLADPTPGMLCTTEGLTCPEFGPPKCGDVGAPCTCTNGHWQCQEPTCPQCADPTTIHAGANCGGQGPMSCPGTGACGEPTLCTCMGPSWIWYCSSGCVDGGGPPDATAD